MQLGAFSVSLPVADLAASMAFYDTLGFEMAGGDPDENWVVLRNGDTVIGLFQGMFTEPILTFNPGHDQLNQEVDGFTDVREIQARLLDAGIELSASTDPNGTDPAHIVLTDPDGNQIMVDQHRPHPDATERAEG